MNKFFLMCMLFAMLFLGCAKRKVLFITSTPDKAKVSYKYKDKEVEKGETPLSFTLNQSEIRTESLVFLRKEEYDDGEIFIGKLPGDEISVHITLEEKDKFVIDRKTKENYERLEKRLLKKEEEIVALQESQTNALEEQLKIAAEKEAEAQNARKPQGDTSFRSDADMRLSLQYIISAQELLKSGKFDEALEKTYKALEINRDFGFAWAVQGTIYYRKKDYMAAIQSWEKAIEHDPNNTSVLDAYTALKRKLGLP